MHTTPRELVVRFKDHPEPRVRENCCTALAVLARAGDERSLLDLIDLAVVDPNRRVRQHAEQAILSMNEAEKAVASSALIAHSQRLNDADSAALNRTMGRLRMLGLPITTSQRPFKDRMWKPGSPRGIRWREQALVGALGALLGLIAGIVIIRLTTVRFGEAVISVSQTAYLQYFLAAVLPAGLCVPFAIRRGQSILLEWDDAAVLVRDAIEVALIIGVLAWIGASIAIGYLGFPFWDDVRFGGLIGLAYGSSAAAVVILGSMSAKAWSGANVRRIGQFLSGGAAGVLTITALLMLTRWLIAGDYELRLQHNAIAHGAWLIAVPTLLALACIVAATDTIDFDVPHGYVSRFNRALTVLLVAGVAAWALEPFLATAPPMTLDTQKLTGVSKIVRHPIKLSPLEIEFRVDFPQAVTISLSQEPGSDDGYYGELARYPNEDSMSRCEPGRRGEPTPLREGLFGTKYLTPGCFVARFRPTFTPPTFSPTFSPTFGANREDGIRLSDAIDILARASLKSMRPDEIEVTLNKEKASFLPEGALISTDSNMRVASTIVRAPKRSLDLEMRNPSFVALRIASAGEPFSASSISFQNSVLAPDASEKNTTRNVWSRLDAGTHSLPILLDAAQSASVYIETTDIGKTVIEETSPPQTFTLTRLPHEFRLHLTQPRRIRIETAIANWYGYLPEMRIYTDSKAVNSMRYSQAYSEDLLIPGDYAFTFGDYYQGTGTALDPVLPLRISFGKIEKPASR